MPGRPRVAGSRRAAVRPSAAAPPVAAESAHLPTGVGPAPAVSPTVAGASGGGSSVPGVALSAEAVDADAQPQGVNNEPPDRVVVGRIGRPQGIKGEVTVEVRTDDPAGRFAAGAVLATDPPERGPLTVAGSRDQGRKLVVLFEGVVDRNAAELLRDTLVLVDAADLPPLQDEDEYYDAQLVGLAAELADGSVLGTVTEVLHLPHGDVLVVRRESGAEALIPFVKAMVPTVDVPSGRLVVHPPEGLLELSDMTDDLTDDPSRSAEQEGV